MTTHPDIGTAWLVLSHGPYLAASIAATSQSTSMITDAFRLLFEDDVIASKDDKEIANNGNRRSRPRLSRKMTYLASEYVRLAIVWIVVSFVISLWTLYAIAKTWETAELFPEKDRIFATFGFSFLTLVTCIVALGNLASLRFLYLWSTHNPLSSYVALSSH